MTKFFQFSFMAMALFSLVLLASCEEDPELPDNITEFESDAQGMGSSDTELTVNLKLAREAEADGNIVVALEPTGVVYDTDFKTEPAATANTITIPVVAGATSASFKIIKTNTTGLKGDEKVTFTLQSVADGLVLGTKNTFTLTFSEIIATSASMEVNGGGPTAPNMVFIDLSGNRQTAIARTTWDLAFSSTADEFRVVLNSPNGMLARAINKTDLATVTAADTVGFGAQLSTSAIFGIVATTEVKDYPDWVSTSTTWMDNPAGDLTKTAIASVSATDSENKVYIINRGTGVSNAALGWKKVRVIRKGSNYTVQYADINSANITSIDVTKNSASRFQYVSFATNNVVTVEPEKAKWDIAWTGFTNTTPSGAPPAPSIPYYFQDVIITNTAGVSTYQYTTSATNTLTYDTFAEANLAGLVYSTSQIGIGSGWRTTGGPPPSPPAGVNAARFYIIKDADGNLYKLQFTALATNGERGKPQFKFALLKKA
ncbi:MAG TPA: HmuY family protein [Cyclobacteriaceae bacterium]|nr:HmuY family protein [Cyclobacteriaceae bacterium]